MVLRPSCIRAGRRCGRFGRPLRSTAQSCAGGAPLIARASILQLALSHQMRPCSMYRAPTAWSSFLTHRSPSPDCQASALTLSERRGSSGATARVRSVVSSESSARMCELICMHIHPSSRRRTSQRISPSSEAVGLAVDMLDALWRLTGSFHSSHSVSPANHLVSPASSKALLSLSKRLVQGVDPGRH